MTLPLEATAAERSALFSTLQSHHRHGTEVYVLNMNLDPLRQISRVTLDGQVNLNTSGISRSLQLSVWDPNSVLHFDTGDPGDGVLFHDNCLRVVKRIWVPELARAWRMPLFTGPVTGLSRTGDLLDIEGQGMEWRALTDVPLHVEKKGKNVVDAIEHIMRECCGERRFRFPQEIKARLQKDAVCGEGDEDLWPWNVCRRLAASINCDLYYDGNATCVLRRNRANGSPVWTFRAYHRNATVTDPVKFETAGDDLFNRAKVTGKFGVWGKATAPAKHRLSPGNMGRNGVPWRHSIIEENEDIKTEKDAGARARHLLNAQLDEMLSLSFSALPVYHLDPGDRCRVESRETSATFTLREASIPLLAGTMSIGFQRRVHEPAARHSATGRTKKGRKQLRKAREDRQQARQDARKERRQNRQDRRERRRARNNP